MPIVQRFFYLIGHFLLFLCRRIPSVMRVAAIDIGSNAIRLQVSSIVRYNERDTIKNLEYVRFPLRLGQDVFSEGRILPATEEKFIKLMTAFKMLLDLYEVASYRVCATSAFRESSNGPEIAARVLTECGMKLEIISGDEEANLVNRAIYKFLDDKNYLHIDVGGGSTELNLYVNKEKLATHSFQLGSVRNMAHAEFPEAWVKLEKWLQEEVHKEYYPVTAIGTGGNINKLFDLSSVKNKKAKSITLGELSSVHFFISRMSLEERISQLMLNPDRADVIVPASEIYLHVMQKAKAKKIIVPDLGLKDGIIESQYDLVKDLIPHVVSPN
jgi:exopolyphosphatase/guanosine-5'-triphosphate,3'-diphosphate pyrophosphatase